jgi:hypothetical protein
MLNFKSECSTSENYTLLDQQPVELNKRRCNMIMLALSENSTDQRILRTLQFKVIGGRHSRAQHITVVKSRWDHGTLLHATAFATSSGRLPRT